MCTYLCYCLCLDAAWEYKAFKSAALTTCKFRLFLPRLAGELQFMNSDPDFSTVLRLLDENPALSLLCYLVLGLLKNNIRLFTKKNMNNSAGQVLSPTSTTVLSSVGGKRQRFYWHPALSFV